MENAQNPTLVTDFFWPLSTITTITIIIITTMTTIATITIITIIAITIITIITTVTVTITISNTNIRRQKTIGNCSYWLVYSRHSW